MTLLATKPSAVPAVNYQYAGSIAVTVGDLIFRDSNSSAKPLTSGTAGASEVADQETFVPLFCGMAAEGKSATAPAGNLLVWPEANDVLMPCVSATFNVGDLLTFTRDGGSGLVNQKLTKTTDPRLAVAVCTKYYGSATTTVQCRVFARTTQQGPPVSGGAGTVGGSTAAAGSTTTDATVLPAGTADTYPVTGADDTKGVRLNAADNVTGRTIWIDNEVSNKILKVYPPTGGTINGAAADAAFSSVSGSGVLLRCTDSTANTGAGKFSAIG